MARPYWSGNLQISFNSFGIRFFPATGAGSEIYFHELSRKTGERVEYEKVSGNKGLVKSSDIVKRFEYRKGEYVTNKPHDIENIRISSPHSSEVVQFVNEGEISPAYFEKPYFVAPKDASAAEAFAVVRRALQEVKKVALGKIAFDGREHLVASSAPPESEEELPGIMAYTMRYADELRSLADYFSDIKKVSIDEDQPSLAKELIKRKTAKFAPERFKDEYELALREMVAARINNELIPHDEPAKKPGKVISHMDALRKSAENGSTATPKASSHKAASADPKKGLTLVKPLTAKASKPKRKSA